jgi:hypothetical protein
VAPEDADELLAELSEALLSRRRELYSGPALELAPDLMLDCWSAGYRVAPGREASAEVLGPPAPLVGVEEAWSSDHRPQGIFVAAGPRITCRRGTELALEDLCPTALALLAQPVASDLDGRVAVDALDPGFLRSHPPTGGGAAGARAVEGSYSEEEAAAVASHLKDLGYIE